MTVTDYLRLHYISDQSSTARYSDGGAVRDDFTLIIDMDGHGNILEASVERVRLGKRRLYITARGETTAPPPPEELPEEPKAGIVREIIKGLRRRRRADEAHARR